MKWKKIIMTTKARPEPQANAMGITEGLGEREFVLSSGTNEDESLMDIGNYGS
jgi:hypothetical protein